MSWVKNVSKVQNHEDIHELESDGDLFANHVGLTEDLIEELLKYMNNKKKEIQLTNYSVNEFSQNETPNNINCKINTTNQTKFLMSKMLTQQGQLSESWNTSSPQTTQTIQYGMPTSQPNQINRTSLLPTLLKTMTTGLLSYSESVTKKTIRATNKANTKRPFLYSTNRNKEFSRYRIKVSIK